MNVKPTSQRLLILPDKPVVPQSDFVIPDYLLPNTNTGVVVSVGEGCGVSVGERVMYGFKSGIKITIADIDYLMIKWHDVFCTVHDDNVPMHNCCYVKLPPETMSNKRSVGSIEINTLNELKYYPTHGTVLSIGPDVKHVKAGDEIFFGHDTFDSALERAFGSQDKRAQQIYKAIRNYAICKDGEWYMMLCELDAYCVKRGDDLLTLNGYVIAKPVLKEATQSGPFEILDTASEDYRANQYEVVATEEGSDYGVGDLILTLRHCDLLLEQVLNNPILEGRHFFVEPANILGKIDAKDVDKSVKISLL